MAELDLTQGLLAPQARLGRVCLATWVPLSYSQTFEGPRTLLSKARNAEWHLLQQEPPTALCFLVSVSIEV